MSFNQREWVNDLVTGVVTGVVGGLVAALFLPEPPCLDLMVGGGVTGLVTGMITLPVKWLLNRRPEATDLATLAPRHPDAKTEESAS